MMIIVACLCVRLMFPQDTVDPERARVVRITAQSEDRLVRGGTGFVWLDGAHVATAYHVIAGACEIKVETLYPRKIELHAKVSSLNKGADLAILKTEGELGVDVPFLASPDSFQARAGMYVIGYPHGIEHADRQWVTPREGTHAMPELEELATRYIKRSLRDLGFPNLKQHVINLDGNVMLGHSGSPLLIDGRVCGIVVGGIADGEFGRSWAVPLEELSKAKPVSADYEECDTALFRRVHGAFAVRMDDDVDPSVPIGLTALTTDTDLGWSLRAQDDLTGIVFVLIRPGHFDMGSPDIENGSRDEETVAPVVITKPFYMSETEVTRTQWAVMTNVPVPDRHALWPQTGVRWIDAKSTLAKFNYRLPTEAEWEYACRAGTSTVFSTGDLLHSSECNYRASPGEEAIDLFFLSTSRARGDKWTAGGLTRGEPASVGTYGKNPWGLYEMHGNVWEFCLDSWHEDGYALAAGAGSSKARDRMELGVSRDRPRWIEDPVFLSATGWITRRGGSWNSAAKACRSANRSRMSPTDSDDETGIRAVLTPARPEYYQDGR